MWLRPDMKEDNAKSNIDDPGIKVREKVAVSTSASSLFLGIDQGHIPCLAQDGERESYFFRVCWRVCFGSRKCLVL